MENETSNEQGNNECEIEHEITRFRQDVKNQGHDFNIEQFCQDYFEFAKKNKLFRIGNSSDNIKLFGIQDRQGYHGGQESNRGEELLCHALFNSSLNKAYEIKGYGQYIVDYQTPTKNVSSDAKWGKIDLVGLIQGSSKKELCFWEVKMRTNTDPIIFAIAELLVYFSQFDFKTNPRAKDNYRHLVTEAVIVRKKYSNNMIKIKNELPTLFIAGEPAYFEKQGFFTHREKYKNLQKKLKKKFQIDLQFVQINASVKYAENDKKYVLENEPEFTVL